MSGNPHELSVSLYIAASPAKVWDVMVNRQEEWWCPRPWRTEILAQDRRPGGRCSMIMHGPDGEQSPQEGIYLAWDEGHRFITTDAVTGDFMPAGPFMLGIWKVTAEGDGTRYHACARHWSEATRQEHEAMGFTDGWMACALQLKDLCEVKS